MDTNQPNFLEPLLEPLEALQRLISRFNNQGVIIGGTAVSMLGRSRFTEDVDAMILLSIQDIPRLLKVAQQEGIEPRIEKVAEFAKKSRVMLMKHVLSDTSIDISLGIMPFEQEMVERSVVHEVDDALKIRLPTPEDLIIMKAIAHRPKDLEDIRTISDKYPNLDHQRIKKWVKEFAQALEQPDLWKQIESILKPNSS